MGLLIIAAMLAAVALYAASAAIAARLYKAREL